MPNFIQRFFTRDHWAHPFTVQSKSPHTDKPETIKISTGKKIGTIAITLFSGISTAGIAAVPMFFLASSFMLGWEIRQRKNLVDLTKNPHAHLPLVPPDGLKAKLPNVANTCWLNAAMKFMASTHYYDPILNLPIDSLSSEQIKLQQILKESITKMRSFDEQSFKRKEMKKLEKAVNALMKDDPLAGGGRQMDATEFFLSLQNFFEYPSIQDLNIHHPNPTFYQSVTVYHADGSKHDPAIKNPEPLITINLSYKEAVDTKTKVNLAEALLKKEYRELSEEGKPVNYKTQQYPLNLPEDIIINFPRVVGVEDDQGRQVFDGKKIKQVRCDKALDLGPNGEFELTSYRRDPITFEENQWVLQPEKRCTYQLVGAIIHGGSDSYGHYTAIERTMDGKYIHHNDSSVSTYSQADALKKCENQAVLLRFKRIKDTNLNTEEIN